MTMATTSSFLKGKGAGGGPHYLSEINVTPFVDVMLVLLVIFMIAAPMMATGFKVDLPQARSHQLAADMKPVEISIDGGGQIYLGGTPISSNDFVPILQKIAQVSGDPEQMRVFVSADRSLDYGRVMQVVSQIASVGITKVAFLSDSRSGVGEKVAP
jgi:biopolymer transport protein TolR